MNTALSNTTLSPTTPHTFNISTYSSRIPTTTTTAAFTTTPYSHQTITITPYFYNITPTGNVTNITTRPPFPPYRDEGITTGVIVAAVFYSILVVLIVSGNLLVIGSFKISRRLRTTTNYFIMSLAIADLSIGTISIPLWVHFSMFPDYILRTVLLKEYTFWLTFDVVVGVSSILNLTMISLERCYALMRPIQHRSIRNRVVVAAILVAWALAAFAGSIRFMLPPREKKHFGLILAILFFILPVTIIFVTYGIIFKIARAHARGRGVRSFRKDLRIATTVAVVIGLFTIAWLPFFTLNFFFSICMDLDPTSKLCMAVPPEIYPVVKWMQYGNSACNPVVYGFRNRDFRIAFKKIVYGMCGRDVRMPNAYSRSTYVATARRRFVRSDSSFEESHSVLYPDQIVPPGMYDMRESYRKAISKGCKTAIKPKAPPKGVAQGLLSINMENLSMPVNGCNGSALKSALADSKENGTSHVNEEQRDAGSDDIEIYPLETQSQANGLVNESFVHGETPEKKSLSTDRLNNRVRFDEDEGIGRGIANKGLETDDTLGESPPSGEDRLLVETERERCHSDVTPVSQSLLVATASRERGSSVS